jgi:HK97 gp10 family phage protein
MVNIIVKIEGLSEIQRAIRMAPAMTTKEVSKAIQKSIFTVQSNAIKEAPANKQVGQGARLKGSFRAQMTSVLRGEVTSNAPYAIFVHEGTRPHPIAVVNKKVLANKRLGQFFGKRVQHPGTRPNPFMMRAIERSKSKMNEFFKTAMINVVKSIT